MFRRFTPSSSTTRSPFRLRSLLVVVGLLILPVGANAQQDSSAEPAPDEQKAGAKPRLAPPELETFVEAPYPPEALEQRVAGEVVLILTIDEAGQVIEAQVEDSPGHGLGEAAREAALEFSFTPAHRAQQPIPSRIRYRYLFELPESAQAPDVQGQGTEQDQGTEQGQPADQVQTGELAGTVMLPDGDTPAVGAQVTLTDPSGDADQLRTDQQGAFDADALAPGRYQVEAKASGHGATRLETEVLADQTTDITLRLQEGDDAAPIEVTVKGESAGEKLQESARAVEVIDTEQAAKEAADMGEVLAREEGVGVRRTGGLGSGTRFSLNGLTGKQVRFFLDGVPLEYAGFPGGVANVPVNLIDRVDVYSGVVPIRLGADALGGAVDLSSPDLPEDDGGRASYQFGSFNTHRAALSGRTVDADSGLYARADGFFDYADNDYPVEVTVSDDRGKPMTAVLPRFHDSYQSVGGGLEVGFGDQSWAERLSMRIFASDLSRDLQHDTVMATPYGEVVWNQTVAGATTRYEHRPTESTHLDLAAGYNYTRRALEDLSSCLYNWYGRCSEGLRGGEIGENPSDRIIWEHAAFARLNATWQLADAHILRLSAAPTFVSRTGDERVDVGRDPLSTQRDVSNFVSGLEYQLDLFDGRLQNIAFVKDYVQLTDTQEPLRTGRMVDRDRTTHNLGWGDSLRFRLTDWAYTKASYEWATRLPTAEEIFGDAILIEPNLELEPERSHNVNLQLALDDLESSIGTWRAKLTGFLRHSDQLIVLLGNNEAFTYNNVYTARSIGAEAAAGWTSPEGFAALDANVTYVDMRNVSDDGAYDGYKGDRIPNRPYLYANASARLTDEDVLWDGDILSLAWRSRYVHWFYRGWASLGRTGSKDFIPTQLFHTVALTHSMEAADRGLTSTLEVQNLTDATVYDFFGVQRPGRAFFVKTTLDF